ncbi:MAG: hypothetical protein PHW73_13955, partial [Atribacterota bacterium]|nr:hypothetical protein [Atribacterota bacterium]
GLPPSSVCCDDGSSSGSSSSSSSSGGSSSSSSSSSGGSGGGGTSITVPVKVSGYDLVTGECNEFTYSNDPLTFYCETPFAQSKNITGEYFKCSQSDEIPVGQAVDDAKKWAVDLLNTVDSYVRSISSMMDTIKKISDKKPKEYCRCDSKYDTGKPICTSNCQYHAPRNVTTTDPDTGEKTTVTIPPSCSLIPCNGNSCQQMINYMTQLINDYVTMKKAFINITISLLKDGRTDPLKELTYSRDMMDSCGRQTTQRGIDYAKTLSCTIAYPSTGFLSQRCYGILNGVVQRPSIDSTDNWFCCQKVIK